MTYVGVRTPGGNAGTVTGTALTADEAGRILLVDDDATNLEVLRQTLDGRGYRLFFARSGEDALKIARKARPFLVLLDVVMPGIDGYETCRRLKEDPDTRDVAVIFLSALDDAKDKVKGFEAGAVDFITKPFQRDEVSARVNTHLSIQRLLRQQHDRNAASAPIRPGDDVTRIHGGAASAGESASLQPESLADPAAPAVKRAPFQTGDVVAYRFRIVRYLASGGMGELYEAEDLELRERVALKTILSYIAGDERSIMMFKREVHLARQVTHPNVCRIFDVFRHRPAAGAGTRGSAEDVLFLAMELLHGETLADRLERDGRVSASDALPLITQMAAGLAAAHRVGVVHRDFKSRNVMLVESPAVDQQERAVITDFGLARRSAEHEANSMTLLSDSAEISGTPAYMAPEQVEGGPVTPATDIYALGVVMYEMITGVCPFVGATAVEIAGKRLHEPAPSPRTHVADLEAKWEATILRCLAREPADRFASVDQIVASLSGEQPRQVGSGPPIRSWPIAVWWILGLLIVALVGSLSLAHFRPGVNGGSRGITSLAVLPFTNANGDPEHDYLSDGISETLIDRLSQLPGIKVVANTSSLRYKGSNADPSDVARALGVTGILVGRIQERGDSLSISVELIDGRDRSHVWGEQYVRTASDLLQVQADIAREIAEKLRLRLTADERQRVAAREMRDPEAHAMVLRGLVHRARGGTRDRQQAAEYFEQAIARDPDYALAHANLSDMYRSLVNSGDLNPKEYLPKAKAAAQKAVELDAGLADAHYALANLMVYEWSWADAEREYRRSIELNPNLALAHRWYAAFLRLMRRHDQAIDEITRARQLDPLSPGVIATLGLVLSTAGRHDDAVAALNQSLQLDPSYPYAHLFLGHDHLLQHRYAEAVGSYQKAIELGLNTTPTQIALGSAYAASGDRASAEAILKRLESSDEYVSPGALAALPAALGQRERAFDLLEQAYRARDLQLQNLYVSPGFDPLRSDPRFGDLLRRVGFPR